MTDRRKIKLSIVTVIVIMVCLQLHLDYFFVNKCCTSSPAILNTRRLQELEVGRGQLEVERNLVEGTLASLCHGEEDPESLSGGLLLANHTAFRLDPAYQFDPDSGRDVLVFLHIQKTGGTTFGRHLVSDLELRTPCKCHEELKKCDCRNNRDQIWTVNRYSTGWRCGLHADWTELTQCVDKMLDRAEGTHRERR